jgi:tetratricopeptide (TPR) repeat protein
MTKFLLFLSIIVFTNTASGQRVSHDYTVYAQKGDSCFLNEDYQKAINFYSLAFKANSDMAKVAHRYKMASCWALLGKADSAFTQLNRIAEKSGFSNYEFVATDINLKSLRTDARWTPLLIKIKNNKDKPEGKM